MRIFRFMSKEEFQNYLNSETIEGKFVKGKACFLEENVPARRKDESVKQLTDLPLNFKSTDFEGQMKELSELISPMFKEGNFEGKLKDLENLSLADFMSTIRENVTADVLVEFQPKKEFEKEYNKVIMSYQKYLIEEIQSNGYSRDTLDCISYKIDLINGFKNGIGVDTATKHDFESVEQTLANLEQAKEEQIKRKLMDNRDRKLTISEKDIGRATINVETNKKDIAKKQMQMDLQKMQEITKDK